MSEIQGWEILPVNFKASCLLIIAVLDIEAEFDDVVGFHNIVLTFMTK